MKKFILPAILFFALSCNATEAPKYASDLPAKTTPVGTDSVTINDSQDLNLSNSRPKSKKVTLQSLPISAAVQTALNGKSAATHDHSGVYLESEVDGSTTNEIQVLDIDGFSLSLSNGGGTITLPSGGDGDNLGAATAADVVGLWAGGNCSGILQSDGTCQEIEIVPGLTLTKLSYVDATSSIQTQLDTKIVKVAENGAVALGTSEIANGACASAVNVSAGTFANVIGRNAECTDVATPSACCTGSGTGTCVADDPDYYYTVTPVGVIGYDPTTNSLTITVIAKHGSVDVLVCNNTGAAVTPGAFAIGLKVLR